jgi:hypothetical protein
LSAAGFAVVWVGFEGLLLEEDWDVLSPPLRLTALKPEAVGTLSTYSLGAEVGPLTDGVDVVGVEVVGVDVVGVELVGVDVVVGVVCVEVAVGAGWLPVSVWAAAGPATPSRASEAAATPPRISCFVPCIRVGRSARIRSMSP